MPCRTSIALELSVKQLRNWNGSAQDLDGRSLGASCQVKSLMAVGGRANKRSPRQCPCSVFE